MSSPPIPSPSGDYLGRPPGPAANVYHSPAVGQSDPEAIRRTHLGEEGYAKAVGRANLLYVILFGPLAGFHFRFAFLHATGQINAPWSLRPGWIAIQVANCAIVLLTLIAGYGSWRLKPWALRVEAVFVLSLLLNCAIYILAYTAPWGVRELVVWLSINAALLVPLLNLLDVRRSPVFKPEYRRVIEATPTIRARARIPWELKLPALALVAIALIVLFSTEATRAPVPGTQRPRTARE